MENTPRENLLIVLGGIVFIVMLPFVLISLAFMFSARVLGALLSR